MSRILQVLNKINGCLCTCDVQGKITYANYKAQEALGYSGSELIGWHILELIVPEERNHFKQTLLTSLQEGNSVSVEVLVLTKDGRMQLNRLNTSSVSDDDGDCIGAIILFEDLNERSQVEEAFVESEHRLANIINFLPDATMVIDRKGKVITWNRAAERMTGLKAKDILGKGNYEYAIPFYGYRRPILIDQVLGSDYMWEQSYPVLRKEEQTICGESFCPAIGIHGAYLRATAAPLLDASGNVVGAIESIRDATENKRAEEIMLIQRDLSMALITVGKIEEALPVCLDSVLRISGMDAGAIYLPGKDYNLMTMAVQRGFSPTFTDRVQIFSLEGYDFIYGKPVYSTAMELRPYFGDYHVEEGLKAVAMVPIFHKKILVALLQLGSRALSEVPAPSRQSIEMVANFMGSIISRLQVEEELRESEERYRQLVEVSPDAIIVHIKGRMAFINDAGARLLGIDSTEKLIGSRVIDFIHTESRQIYIDLIKPLSELGAFPLTEMIVVRLDGTAIHTEVTGAALIFQGQEAVQIIVRNISIRKQAQEGLSRELHKFKILYDLAVAMSSVGHTMEENLELTIEKTRELFACECAMIFIYDKAKSELFPYTLSGVRTPEFSNIRLPHGKGFVGLVAASNRGYIIEDYESCTLFEHLVDEVVTMEELKSWMAAPISIGNNVLGTLVVAHRQTTSFAEDELDTLIMIANLVAVEITGRQAQEKLQKSLENLGYVLEGTVNALSATAEKKDPYTAGHQRRVAELACAIANELGLSRKIIENVKIASTLHDIGKLQIPTDILTKPGQLNDIELMLVKTHSQAGFEIVKTIPFAQAIARTILQHHERMDGSGYPHGLSGNQILLEARILAVADVVEAMASHGPYRPALGIDVALQEIKQGSGFIYDKTVVEACLNIFLRGDFTFGS